MTEQQWMQTLSPTERCFPRAVSRHRAIYQGWIAMPREPGEQNDERTQEQREQQQRQEDNQQRSSEKSNDKYWGPNGPN